MKVAVLTIYDPQHGRALPLMLHCGWEDAWMLYQLIPRRVIRDLRGRNLNSQSECRTILETWEAGVQDAISFRFRQHLN